MILTKYGLSSFFTENLTNEDRDNLGKVIAVHKKSFRVILNDGSEINAIAKGSLLHYKSKNTRELPKLGDFVVLNSIAETNAFIKCILPRKNELQRKLVGKDENQIIATNIDYAFITISADMQFNIRKIERIVLAAEDSNIEPIIIITKADLAQNISQEISLLQDRFGSVQIIATSMAEIASVQPLKDLLQNNKVAAFIGSSGSGKSTLTNMLLGADLQKTLSVGDTDRGQHTTTHREMFLLPSGGCIIDNPGIKEFALWLENNDSIDNTFADIAELARRCKFRDCTHTSEPSCAVIKAVAEGRLSADRYHNFLKIQAEEEDISLAKLKHERKESKKAISKELKSIKKYKNKEQG
ncbi:MAG: ribosome small subunit-dependent GTPase A [Alphaproteobacteria bacterium]|jgi:ribosome biogenesis GTPase|nr:ribosome small subunit-dependent GTPase A [Alphaproteobacteria bacterium]